MFFFSISLYPPLSSCLPLPPSLPHHICLCLSVLLLVFFECFFFSSHLNLFFFYSLQKMFFFFFFFVFLLSFSSPCISMKLDFSALPRRTIAAPIAISSQSFTATVKGKKCWGKSIKKTVIASISPSLSLSCYLHHRLGLLLSLCFLFFYLSHSVALWLSVWTADLVSVSSGRWIFCGVSVI